MQLISGGKTRLKSLLKCKGFFWDIKTTNIESQAEYDYYYYY